jgi:hypothetical protein
MPRIRPRPARQREVDEVHGYFDVLTMLGQLGHIQPPPEAEEVPAPGRDGGPVA